MNHPQDNPFAELASWKFVTHDITEEMGGNLYVVMGNKFSTVQGQGAMLLEKKYGPPSVELWKEQVDNHMKEAVQYTMGLPTSEEYLRQTIYAET